MTFKNKTVLITGADGFFGSHLTEALVNIFYSPLIKGVRGLFHRKDKTILITGGTGFFQGKMTRIIGKTADVCYR
jgi:nucleoside-diphosphate-sugar epimerase